MEVLRPWRHVTTRRVLRAITQNFPHKVSNLSERSAYTQSSSYPVATINDAGEWALSVGAVTRIEDCDPRWAPSEVLI